MKSLIYYLLFAVCSLFAACGSDSTSPTSPVTDPNLLYSVSDFKISTSDSGYVHVDSLILYSPAAAVQNLKIQFELKSSGPDPSNPNITKPNYYIYLHRSVNSIAVQNRDISAFIDSTITILIPRVDTIGAYSLNIELRLAYQSVNHYPEYIELKDLKILKY